MALKTQAQLVVESNFTYVDNTSGSITPQGVRNFNYDFISSSITADLTSSMSVGFAQTASFLLGSIASASFAQNAATASYLSGTIASASYALNASTASYVAGLNSASFTPNAIVTASAAGTTITFTKGDSTTFAVTLSQSGSVASASYATFAQTAATASYVATASYAQNANLLDGLDSTVFVGTGSYNTFSSSIASRTTVIETTYATTGSNTFTGTNIFTTVTASNALITSASVLNLKVIYETASVIYSSGSNQFGDALDDVQTLWGTVTLPSGPLTVTGSINASAGFTGSLNGNASTATSATSATTAATASYVALAVSASRAISAANADNATNATSATTAATASSIASLNQNVIVTGSVNSSQGYYSKTPWTGSYTDGIIVDYTTGTGRVSVGTADGIGFYNGGQASTQLAYIGVNGAITASIFSGSFIGNVTGNATTATTASYWSGSTQYAVTAGTAATASSVGALVQAVVISGSLTGLVTSASIASNTSSLDFSLGNFYTSLVTGTTNFNITNPKVGQTVNLLLTTAGTSASASFSSNVKQVSGSSYAPTSTTGAKDILTFISWDGTTVYLANVKNLI